MIIIVCQNDNDIQHFTSVADVAIGHCDRRGWGINIGSYYTIWIDIPVMEQDESLFILGHGDFNSGEPSVIGDQGSDFALTAQQLYEDHIRTILPEEFNGNVYIHACHSADYDDETPSFSKNCQDLIRSNHGGDIMVYGRQGEFGDQGGSVLPPTSNHWIPAET